jgi:RNA-directed DNA polymerase
VKGLCCILNLLTEVRQGRMTKASIQLQELRRKIYRKAKTEKHWRFWGLYCHICKDEVLQESYRLAKANDGAPGIDGKSFDEIEAEGVVVFLEGIRQELLTRTHRPLPNRRVEIPKGNGKTRTLGIPTIKDRVVQGALYVSKTPRKKKYKEIGKKVKAALKSNWNKPLNEVIQTLRACL